MKEMNDTSLRLLTRMETVRRNKGRCCNLKTVQAGKDYHADGVQIAGADYYVYYTPVYSDAGDVIGMGFAGEKTATVDAAKKGLVRTLLLISVAIGILYLGVLIFLALKIRKSLAKTTAHIERIANGSISEDVEGSSAIAEIDTLIDSSKILKEKLNNIVTSVNDHVVNLQQDTSSLNERADFSNEEPDRSARRWRNYL